MALVAFVLNRTLLRDPREFLRRGRAAAEERGWEPWFAPTSDAENGLALTRRAVAAGASLVFAVGGDGTVRACAEALAGTDVPLAIVPLGTANLTARALGLPTQADRAVDVGFGGRDRRIDLARPGPHRPGPHRRGRCRRDQCRRDGCRRDAVRRDGGDRPGRGRRRGGTRAAQTAVRLGRLRGDRRDEAVAAGLRFHRAPGRRRTAAAAGPVRGGGQRRPPAGRLHPAARGQAR